jgi:signal transduction histidine kinase
MPMFPGGLAAELDPAKTVEFGGGRRGAFLLLRYVFIIAACYLLLFDGPKGQDTSVMTASMVALALSSNVVLSLLPARLLHAWSVEVPVLVTDALWVSWALHATGAVGGEFILLYLFVLFVAAAGRHLVVPLVGSVAVGIAHAIYVWDRSTDPTQLLLRACFFFAVSLFYGTVLTELRRERLRGDHSLSWAQLLRREVAKATGELQFLYHEAKSATRVRDEFVAGMSHELRTPIHIILGYAEIMLDQSRSLSPVQIEEVAMRIRHAALQLQGLVDGVLDLSRLQQGREPLKIEPTCIEALVHELLGRERPASHPGVTVRCDTGSGLPAVHMDAQKVSIVLENLLSNALKFTERGAVSMSVAHDRTTDAIVFRVADSGPGSPPETLAHIWEPFHASATGPTGSPQGIGLGLAIVKRYVELLGGTIRVTSSPVEGTSFEFSLPVGPPTAPAIAALEAA